MAIRRDPEAHEVNALLAAIGELGGQRVLEIGCGDGRLLQRYAHLTAHVTGIDPDDARIAEARRTLPPDLLAKVTLQVAGWRDFRPNRLFDTIILGWSL